MENNNQPSSSSSSVPKIVGGIVAILVCCSCVLILGVGAVFYQAFQGSGGPSNFPTLIPPILDPSTPQPTPELQRQPVDLTTAGTLETLIQTDVPENIPYELACRLQAICNVPTTVPAKSYEVGDKETFWVRNVDTTQAFQATATLQYATPHSYLWVEDGVEYSQNDLKRLGDTFEDQIYPIDREFFGSEWTPGVDNDPHIYILYVRGMGNTVAGYFSSPDEYNPMVQEHANGHEMFLFNADLVQLDSEEAYSVLAHEFQHMIHWNTDRNESSWLNEGFSVVAELLNGYSIGFDQIYALSPDLSLPDWSPDQGSNGPHYGQSFLYLTYFLDRFGEKATQAVVKDQENSLTSIDGTLKSLNITDPLTGNLITADDVFMDWAATMYLMDGSVGDGRYQYKNYPEAPSVTPIEGLDSCPGTKSGSVNQYGVDYIVINCAGEHNLQFNGSTVVGLLPVDAHSGDYAFWSNKGDESDMTLTREFDLTNVSGPVDLTYSMWYDLETDYDYLFLEASTDGETWQILTTPSGTAEDPSGNSFGWGYNGQTNGWVEETVDLSQFAGQSIQIRFEYITDAAVNGEGFLLDDVGIEAIDYQSDFESDNGGWEGAGFVRVENVLPQTYRLSLIVKGDDGTTVTPITVNADQTAEIPLSLQNGEEATLIVTGTTRFTRQPAAYQVEIK